MPAVYLVPLSLGELLDQSFSSLRKHFWLFAGIMVAPQALLAGLNILMQICLRPPRPFCAGGVRLWRMFSLVRALPSATSAEACVSLFGCFLGRTARSDSSPAYTSGVRRSALPDRSAGGNTEEVSGSRACSFSACLGSTTTRDHPPTRDTVGACVAFPFR